MKIQDIIKISGDSYLENYGYSDGIIKLQLELDELDRKILIKIKSSTMFFNVPEDKEPAYRTCYMELTQLLEVLNLKNNIYVPSDDFGSFMKEKRNNLNLVYGSNSKENEFIFSLCSDIKIVSVVINKIEDISFEFLD